MATDPEELLRRRQVMPLTGMGQPVGVPAPLPILSANMATPSNPPPVVAPPVAAAPGIAPGTGLGGLGGGAAFGIYPKPSSQFSTNANDAALRRGVSATGPSTFVPAVQPVQPNRLDNLTDPRSTQYAGGPTVPAGMGQPVPGQPAPPPAIPGAAAPAVAGPPGAEGTQPTNASEGPYSPVAATPASVAAATGATAEPALGGLTDTQARLGRLQASNAAVPRGGLSVIGNPGPDAAQAMFDGAALRTAAGQGSWSPRRGFQGNDDAIRAASIPIANRARMGEAQLNADTSLANTGMREAGDTARLGLRTAADASQAAITGGRDQQRLDMERQINTLRGAGLGLDNATKQRIEVVQQEIANAKTPEARRAAGEKLAALTGKERPNRFKAIEVGGGQVVDPTTGVATQQPKSVVLYDEATGQMQTSTPGAGAAAAKPAVAEGSMSTSNGKPIRFVGGKWVPA